MPTRDDVKRAVCEVIDRHREKIVKVGETIGKNPELGFKEFKTSRLVEEIMREIGLEPKGGLALTGVRGAARGTKDGPSFALLGELDGLVVAGHPVADPQTGAAHACGHNAQIAGLLGAAMGLAGANAAALLGADQVTETGHRSGSTAMGDSFQRGMAETELFNGAE